GVSGFYAALALRAPGGASWRLADDCGGAVPLSGIDARGDRAGRADAPAPRGRGRMSTEASLLHAICENPDDDTPRLVYSDWLEEHGELARAEFIRLQIELARMPPYDPRRLDLEERASVYEELYGESWQPEIPEEVPALDSYRRGFLALVK